MPAENSVVKCRRNEHVTWQPTEESEPHKEMEDLAADEVICLDEKFPKNKGQEPAKPKRRVVAGHLKPENVFSSFLSPFGCSEHFISTR